MALPALTRGLIIMEELIRNPYGLRYGELKQALPGVGDASLIRLIDSLRESGHMVKEENRYLLSPRVQHWSDYIGREQNLQESIKILVDKLSEQTGESAGFCLYRDKRLIIQHSISCQDSISIIGSGKTLHYEGDHAASLAVMDLLSPEEQNDALNSLYSKTDRADWQAGKAKFFKGNYYADSSRLRKGISRMALPWEKGGERGALFLCLPTVRLIQREDDLAELMFHALVSLGN